MSYSPSVIQASLLALSPLVLAFAVGLFPPGNPKCDADNGGLVLPEGFCATVVASQLGPVRQLAVGPNGEYFTFATEKGGPTSLRASGVAVGTEGSLYISADQNGKIWRVTKRM